MVKNTEGRCYGLQQADDAAATAAASLLLLSIDSMNRAPCKNVDTLERGNQESKFSTSGRTNRSFCNLVKLPRVRQERTTANRVHQCERTLARYQTGLYRKAVVQD